MAEVGTPEGAAQEFDCSITVFFLRSYLMILWPHVLLSYNFIDGAHSFHSEATIWVTTVFTEWMKLLSQGKTVLSASVRLLLKPHILPCKPSPTVHFLFTFSFTFGPFLWNRKFTLCFPLRDKFYIDTGWSVLCFFFSSFKHKRFLYWSSMCDVLFLWRDDGGGGKSAF